MDSNSKYLYRLECTQTFTILLLNIIANNYCVSDIKTVCVCFWQFLKKGIIEIQAKIMCFNISAVYKMCSLQKLWSHHTRHRSRGYMDGWFLSLLWLWQAHGERYFSHHRLFLWMKNQCDKCDITLDFRHDIALVFM